MRNQFWLSVSAAAVFVMPGIVTARESQRDAASNERTIEEIVVTATKRAERLQDVPIAVTAVRGEELTNLNIVDTKELVRLVPSVVLGSGTAAFGNFQQSWQVRGVGTQANQTTLHQSVSVVVDGIPMANAAMARMDFADIERIEVLKGPQGMLFGRNASAGLINIVTARPEFGEAELSTRLSYGDASEFNDKLAQATANFPLGDTVAARVNAYYHDRSGYITNVLNGEKFNAYEDKGIRAKLLWQVSDNFTALLTGEYSEQDDPNRRDVITSVIPGSPIDLQLQQLGITPGIRSTKAANFWPASGESDVTGAILHLDWTLGDYTLTSTSDYREYEIKDLAIDLVNTSAPSLINSLSGPMELYTQELQLTSPSGGRVEYVAGLFYDHFQYDQTAILWLTDPFFFCEHATPFGPTCATRDVTRYRTESIAAYGQATIRATDRLRFIVGGRVTEDSTHLRFTRDAGPPPGFTSLISPFISPPIPLVSQEFDETNFSWRAGPQFNVTDDLMVYFTASTGYKGAGWDSALILSATDSLLVDSETSLNYEIGLKSSWLEGRLIANLDVFHTTFEDFQTQTLTQTAAGLAQFRVDNAPELRTQGFGLDLRFLPTQRLDLSASVAYTDAEFTDFPAAACFTGQTAAQGCVTPPPPAPAFTNATGNVLPGAPEWSYSVAGSYTFPVTGGLNAFIGADWAYRTEATVSPAGDPAQEIPGYGLLGASVGIEDAESRWRFAVSGKNLLDKEFCQVPFQALPSPPFPTFGPSGALTRCSYSEQAFRAVYATLDFNF